MAKSFFMMDRTDQNINVQIVIDKYFADNPQRMRIKKDEILLERDEPNDKLFLVLSGELVGYSYDDIQGELEMFRISKGMFAGVYSFFSESNASTVKLVAVSDCEVAYITKSDIEKYSEREGEDYSREFIPIIVNELRLRHHVAVKISIEKEAALQQILKTEKLASLGQMAASIAHELNNAVAVLHHNAEYIAREITSHLELEDDGYVHFFAKGLIDGRKCSTQQIRNKQKDLAGRLPFDDKLLKKIAMLAPAESDISRFSQVDEFQADKYTYYWEIGASIHAMLVASEHSKHVVNSVRKLGAPKNDFPEPVNINETLDEALILINNRIEDIRIIRDESELPSILAGKGELIQVWVNIIKNAADSLHSAKISSPEIKIVTAFCEENICISIEDNGPGIPEELQHKIFFPNFTTKVRGLDFGLGLGLTIVQRIIESYQGKIELESVPGHTKFTVVLPIGVKNEQT